jgi:sulfide:quinone oxidoreductase
MGALLAEHGIRVLPAAQCEQAERHRVLVNGRDGVTVTLTPDRVLALPQLLGPHLRGVPCSENGFIPIDRYCAVRGTERVYAAGDATDYPVKHGGLAAQQADVAAATVAALAGAPVVPRPFRPTLEGLLLTGGQPRYLTARLTGATPFGSRMRAGGSAVPEPKIVAPHLTELLHRAGS